MELVVDANILLASFLKEAKTRELLLDSRLHLQAPEHLLRETSSKLKRDSSLRKRISLSDEDLEGLIQLLTLRVQVIPIQAYSPYLQKALDIAPHPEDAPYLAVALLNRIPIWSNDRGLKNQKEVQIYSTSELIGVLSKKE